MPTQPIISSSPGQEPTVFISEKRLTSKKIRRVVLLVLVVFLLVVALVLIIFRTSWLKTKEEEKIGGAGQINLETISPWDEADQVLPQRPFVPDSDTLFNFYIEARKAALEFDQEMIKERFSRQVIWFSENPMNYTGAVEEDLPVYSEQNLKPEEFFKTRFKDFPDLDTIQSGEVQEFEGILDTREIIIRDADGKDRAVLLIKPWRYVLSLKVTEIPASGLEKNGSIIFVFDNGNWKYLSEDWE